MRDITELVSQQKPPEELTSDEYQAMAVAADWARLRDFSPEEDRIRWPKPIGPKWK